jgi:deazaflavin-dependent oxidoreductase (nitroreductase family)
MASAAPKPWTPQEERFGSVVVKWMSVLNVWLFRLTGGWLGAKFLRGAPVCLITVTGRKSGQPFTVPLIYVEDGADLVVVASKGGMSHHPLWFHNMCANPRVEVELPDVKRTMIARQATSAEKTRLWPKACAIYPDYADYQARTTRDIPLMILSPI